MNDKQKNFRRSTARSLLEEALDAIRCMGVRVILQQNCEVCHEVLDTDAFSFEMIPDDAAVVHEKGEGKRIVRLPLEEGQELL